MDGVLLSVGTGLGGTEITEEEYDTLLAEIREACELADRLFRGEITIEEVPAEWREELQYRVDKMARMQAEAEEEATEA